MRVEVGRDAPSRSGCSTSPRVQTIERAVTDVIVERAGAAAADAWQRITCYYDDGDFPATPSKNSCRFCSFKALCRADGIPVPA